MQPESENLKRYRDELPALVRGRLSPARGHEIHQAAETDPSLAKAIKEEYKLESFLATFDVPEMSSGFRKTFWKRFYTQQAGRQSVWIRLIGPAAAILVLSLGAYLFMNGSSEDPQDSVESPVAIQDSDEKPDESTSGNNNTSAPSTSEEIDFEFATDKPDDLRSSFALEELELLKQLHRSEFDHLDLLENSEDMALIDSLSLLLDIDAKDEQ